MQIRTGLSIFLFLLSIGTFLVPGNRFAQRSPSGNAPNSETSDQQPSSDPGNPSNTGGTPADNPSSDGNTFLDKKEIKKYNDQFKKGLLSVFQAEANHNFGKLNRLGLTHPIPRVRAAAALALGRLGAKSGIKTLHRMIDRDGESVRQAAYQGLADIGSRTSLDYFYAGAKSPDKEIRIASFRGMGKTGDPGAREVLLRKGLTSDEKEIVKASISGLGHYQAPEDIKVFIDYLNSSDEELQKVAVEALGNHKTRTAMRILEDAFRDKENLRPQILDTLTARKNTFAVFALLRILNNFSDSEAVVKEVAIRLYKLKAFGRYMTVNSENVPLLKEPFVGAPKIRDLDGGEVGKILQKSPKRYILDLNGQRVEDFYYKVSVNTKFKDAFSDTASGWVFGSYIKIRNITPTKKSKKGKRPSILDDETPAPQPTPPPSDAGDDNPSPEAH